MNSHLPVVEAFALGPFGGTEAVVVLVVVTILFLGPRLHRGIRGIVQAPVEFLRGRKEGRVEISRPNQPTKSPNKKP